MNIPAHFIGGPRCGDDTINLTTVMPYPPEYRFGPDVYDLRMAEPATYPRYLYRRPDTQVTIKL